jgi:membrane-associated phospholipid phosphatase
LGKAVAAVLVIGGWVCAPAGAGTTLAQGLGDATGPLVAVGIAATFFGPGENARNEGARAADAAVISLGLAELAKPNLNVDGEGKHLHGFPSAHTAIAFGTATALADLHPKQKWAFYAGAALIGWSRVECDAHSWKDVLGGAALGFGVGKWSMSASDGLMLARVFRF